MQHPPPSEPWPEYHLLPREFVLQHAAHPYVPHSIDYASSGFAHNGVVSAQNRITQGCELVPWYICTNMADKEMSLSHRVEVERVQTGVRLEKRMLKVLKAIAEQKEMSLGDLVEGIVLHAFEGKAPFSPQTIKDIEQFRSLYGLTLRAQDSHQLRERR